MREKFLHSDTAAEFLGRHEVLLSALHREHVADHLPGNRQRGAVPISLFQFSRVGQGEFGRLTGRELGSLDQYSLDMLVPLLGNRHPHHLLGRTLLVAAQSRSS